MGRLQIKIKQFIDEVKTTKDTVRHYESLDLIKPKWNQNVRIYGENEVNDFYAIKEMQSLNMSLKEIQIIFGIKRNDGCASPKLLNEIIETLKEKLQLLFEDEQAIQYKRKQIAELLANLTTINTQK